MFAEQRRRCYHNKQVTLPNYFHDHRSITVPFAANRNSHSALEKTTYLPYVKVPSTQPQLLIKPTPSKKGPYC